MQATKKPPSPNRQRLAAGEPQVGRNVDTARARKPIAKAQYELLIRAARMGKGLRSPTRKKLIMAYTLLYVTGCRVSEIVRFHTDDLAEMIRENEYSLTNATKTKTTRLIVLDADGVCAGMLKQIMPKLPGLLFPRNGSEEPISPKGFTLLLNNHMHRVLGPLYSTHSFRGGYITESFKSGNDAKHTSIDVGHKNVATTLRYRDVTPQDISRGKTRRQW